MRNRFYSVAVAGLLLAPVFSTVQAQIVDQSNYANQGGFGEASSWNGQTFTPSASTSAGAGFNLNVFTDYSRSGTLTVELWSGVPSNGATLLASGSSAFSLLAFQQSMIDVFWPAITVTPGTQYFLAMNVPTYGGTNLNTTYGFNTYPGGDVWYNCCSPFDTGVYTEFKNYDLTFEEFSTSQVTSTPEPASMALLGTGLVGVFGAVRRKRKTQLVHSPPISACHGPIG